MPEGRTQSRPKLTPNDQTGSGWFGSSVSLSADGNTLLVGGRYDECTPGHLEQMHRRIAGSQLVIIEDASHLCFAEQPDEFNRVINSFMT